LDLAQFRELAAFAQFGSDLDETTQRQLSRGERLVELLKQGQFQPFEVTDQVISVFAGTRGLFDPIPVNKVLVAEKELLEHIKTRHSGLYDDLKKKKELTSDIDAKLTEVVKNFLNGLRY
jgi:F-type H+-transporting ATPase subunit alpha